MKLLKSECAFALATLYCVSLQPGVIMMDQLLSGSSQEAREFDQCSH
jgi:hypothetical protein